MKQKTIVQSVRFDKDQIIKITWLKSKQINPAILIRKGFDREFERFKKEFEKQNKERLPF